MTYADRITQSNLIFNYGFESATPPFFIDPPFSFSVTTVTFDPTNVGADIFNASNPNYTGSPGNGTGAGEGSGGGGGGGGGASAFGVPMSFEAAPGIARWDLVAAWEAHGTVYALRFNDNTSNVATRPYSRRFALYVYNGATSQFEYINFPPFLQYISVGTRDSDLRAEFGIGRKLINGKPTIQIAVTHLPFPNPTTSVGSFDGAGFMTLIFEPDGTITTDIILTSDIIAQTSFTLVGLSPLYMLYWDDLEGLPFTGLSSISQRPTGTLASPQPRYEIVTGSSGFQMRVDEITPTTNLNPPNNFFADDTSMTQRRFDQTITTLTTSVTGSPSSRDRDLKVFVGKDNVNPEFEFYINTLDIEFGWNLPNLSNSGRLQSWDGSILHNTGGVLRDENFLNPTGRLLRYYFRESLSAPINPHFTVNQDVFGAQDSNRQIFTTSNRHSNKAGDIIRYASRTSIYFYVRGSDYAVNIAPALNATLGSTSETRLTSIVGTQWGFMFLTTNFIVFIQPTIL